MFEEMVPTFSYVRGVDLDSQKHASIVTGPTDIVAIKMGAIAAATTRREEAHR
jgi:hypothetical protein